MAAESADQRLRALAGRHLDAAEAAEAGATQARRAEAGRHRLLLPRRQSVGEAHQDVVGGAAVARGAAQRHHADRQSRRRFSRPRVRLAARQGGGGAVAGLGCRGPRRRGARAPRRPAALRDARQRRQGGDRTHPEATDGEGGRKPERPAARCRSAGSAGGGWTRAGAADGAGAGTAARRVGLGGYVGIERQVRVRRLWRTGSRRGRRSHCSGLRACSLRGSIAAMSFAAGPLLAGFPWLAAAAQQAASDRRAPCCAPRCRWPRPSPRRGPSSTSRGAAARRGPGLEVPWRRAVAGGLLAAIFYLGVFFAFSTLGQQVDLDLSAVRPGRSSAFTRCSSPASSPGGSSPSPAPARPAERGGDHPRRSDRGPLAAAGAP